jgi:hypothetical protein
MGPLDDEFVDDVRKRVKEQKAKRKIVQFSLLRHGGLVEITPHRRSPLTMTGLAGGVRMPEARERRPELQVEQKESPVFFWGARCAAG